MNRESLDRWCERGILGLVLGILVFSPLAYGAVRMQDFLVVQFFMICALILWLHFDAVRGERSIEVALAFGCIQCRLFLIFPGRLVEDLAGAQRPLLFPSAQSFFFCPGAA